MVAINQGEDQLAREALVRKARAASLASQMKLELKEQLKLADSLRQTLENLQHKLRESQEQRDHLLASNARAASADRVTNVLRSKSWWTKDSSLERLTQEVLDRQHRLEGYQELHRSNVETEFLRLPSDQNIESELKRLKGIASKDKQ
jgi:phage shock protein A